MSQSDADKFGLDADERRMWVRLDDAKANLSLASGSARWFKRVSITIANGEEVGALVPGDPNERAPKEDHAAEIESALFEAIRTAWNAGARRRAKADRDELRERKSCHKLRMPVFAEDGSKSVRARRPGYDAESR